MDTAATPKPLRFNKSTQTTTPTTTKARTKTKAATNLLNGEIG